MTDLENDYFTTTQQLRASRFVSVHQVRPNGSVDGQKYLAADGSVEEIMMVAGSLKGMAR